jgi:uncharacterized protein
LSQSVPPASLAGSVIEFGRLLKENGIAISVPSVMNALSGVSRVGVQNPSDFRTVLRAVFVARVEESPTFDRLFKTFWLEGDSHIISDGLRCESSSERETTESDDAEGQLEEVLAEESISVSQEQDAWNVQPYSMYSPKEFLRDKDFKDVPEGEDQKMARLIRELLAPLLRRVRTRKKPAAYGAAVDIRRLLRRNVAYGGEIFELPRMRNTFRIKKILFLCDVSGSMDPYLRFILRFIKELQACPTKVETFVFATQLHRVTRYLAHLPFPRALKEIAGQVRDWSGGTRMGECLHELTTLHGDSFLRPSTVVLIHSDGWDRGDADLLDRQMSKIHNRVYRILWINPLLGGRSYEPTCRGMKTALPYVDSFLPGHNLAGLATVVGTLRGLL